MQLRSGNIIINPPLPAGSADETLGYCTSCQQQETRASPAAEEEEEEEKEAVRRSSQPSPPLALSLFLLFFVLLSPTRGRSWTKFLLVEFLITYKHCRSYVD